jgi:hypothetical protein
MFMITPRRALLAGCITLITGTASAAGTPQTYTYTTISVKGSTRTQAAGLNDKGTVVGYAFDGNQNAHGWRYYKGTLAKFDVPNVQNTFPIAINVHDVVVGYTSNFGTYAGFIYDGKGFTTVTMPGAIATTLVGINRRGEMLGASVSPKGVLTAFTYQNGVFTPLTSMNTPSPVAISATGAVAATYEQAHTYEVAFLFAKGQATTIPLKNSVFAQSYAINASNVVVGQYANAQLQQYGFVYDHGKARLLGYPGSNDSYLAGINDANMIIGNNFPTGPGSSTCFVYQRGTFWLAQPPGVTDGGCAAINNKGEIIGYIAEPHGALDSYLAVPNP